MASKCVALLPTEVVTELEGEGLVTRLPVVRAGGGIDPVLVVTGIQVATTLITFAQGPSAFEDISKRIHRWWTKRRPESVHIQVSGKNGTSRLKIDNSVNPEDLAALLRLIGSDDQDI
jgi:hypothetical protein